MSKRAFEVYSKRDSKKETIIAIADNSIEARKLADRHFVDAKYFDLRTNRCHMLDRLAGNFSGILTGKEEVLYHYYEKAGWTIVKGK